MVPSFFLDKLYPLQDQVLRVIHAANTEFYLTGGTAASRGYLNHRFSEDLDLFVNDVPAHVGNIVDHAVLGRLDSPENILANKVTALIDRNEPKDLADVWGFCGKFDLSLTAAIEDSHSKAAGIFPADLARILCSATKKDWEAIRWIQPPPAEQFISDLHALGEGLIL